MEFTRTVDNTLYSRRALAAAREAYREYCVVRVTPVAEGLADVAVQPHRQYEAEARQVILEFWNFFLDTACQQRLEVA